jgi:hypothetical protein
MRALTVIALLLLTHSVFAGGPAFVAGSSYFQPATKGSLVVWAGGLVNYYTDQGGLSPMLPGSAADSFVANAFSQWTSVPTAALSAVRQGQLAEDVTGANVSIGSGQINLPADIQPSASGTPVGIVYDHDGSLTDALLGTGAGASVYCAQNSVFGGIDNIDPSAVFLHALIVINGNCAATSSQLADLKYHLVRMIGRVLGLDWSQANLNVITRKPLPTSADFAGFSVMHEYDPQNCVPVAICYSNNNAVDPSQPKTDDQAALSRLYPVTPQNLASFPGKQVFRSNTARVRGTLYFNDGWGGTAQPMQGVNIVARWMDLTTGAVSRSLVVTSISGFLYRGNAGNMVSGYIDPSGNRFDRFGSDDSALEGYFDLAGLPLPGGTMSNYQLTVEAVDPLWSATAGPYGSSHQVIPSGTFLPYQVTVAPGDDVQVDLVMTSSAVAQPQWYSPNSYAVPVQVPGSGIWQGTFSNGNTDFFHFPAQANRTLSVTVDALDESGNAALGKALPVIGLWGLGNPGQSPAEAYTPYPLNTTNVAQTRLDAQVLQSTPLRLGIADYRGDGRADFVYRAKLFYGDRISPSRASVAGNAPITLTGFGLQANTAVQSANNSLPVLAASATQLLIDSPPALDGVYDIQLNDAKSGGSSQMIGVLTIGAGPSDTIKLISGGGSATPIGGQVNQPFAVQVVAADGKTPVAGASIQFSSSPAVGFSICSGASSCTVLSDESGRAATAATMLSTGTSTLTAKLAPASYARPQQVQVTVLGIASSLDISLPLPSVWVAQGASLGVPVKARVLSNGNAVGTATVNYQITQGSGTLSSASAQTDAAGYATSNLQLSSIGTTTQVSVCVAPGNSPCLVFKVFAVSLSSLQLQPVGGTLQVLQSGKNFHPVVMRVIDSSSPPHPVQGADVVFQSYTGRVAGNQPIVWAGEAGISQPSMPVILASSHATVASDVNGLTSFPISTGGFAGNIAVAGSATVGATTAQFEAQQLGP